MKRQILMVSFFVISFVLAVGSAWAAGQGKGGGKGGFGEGGAACATFGDDAVVDEIRSDGRGEYCNGTDGQVSVPKRFRIDLKKFNSNDREISVSVIVPPFSGDVTFQSQLQYVDDGTGTLVPTGTELDFPSLTPAGSRAFVSMSVDFKTGPKEGFRINYGKFRDLRLPCPEVSSAQPVEVTCTATDGQCIKWTITGSSACLQDLKTLQDMGDVGADFSLDVVAQ